MATYDREKLIEGLNNLTGFDFTKAELRVRREGDMTPDVTFSKRFQAEVAAIALKESIRPLSMVLLRRMKGESKEPLEGLRLTEKRWL